LAGHFEKKNKNVKRKSELFIDELGRILLPHEFASQFTIETGRLLLELQIEELANLSKVKT
jgi:DNA replication protein DnaD